MKPVRDVPLVEAAKILDCKPRGMRNLVGRGMPHVMGKVPKGGGRRPILVNMKEIQAWGEKNNAKAFRAPVKKIKPTELPPQGNPDPVAPEQAKYGIEAELERYRKVTYRAYLDHALAIKGADATSIRLTGKAYREATKQLAELEKQVDHGKEIRAEIQEEFNRAMAEWHVPLRSLLDAAPRALATRFDGCAAAKAEVVVRDWIDKELLPMMERTK